MDSDRVSPELTDAAVSAAGPIERFYVRGGGSASDLRTDLSYVVEAVLDFLVSNAPAPVTARRRLRGGSYTGPERRATRP